MKYNDIFIIEYDDETINVELRDKYYKTGLNGIITLHINGIYKGVYLYYRITRFFNQKYVEIIDIPRELSEKYKNKGIGSRVLLLLDKIVKSLNIKNIIGGISRLDFDHLDRLQHFYTKNNYKILFDNKNEPCSIIKKV